MINVKTEDMVNANRMFLFTEILNEVKPDLL